MKQDGISTDAMQRVVMSGDPADPMVQFIAEVLNKYNSGECQTDSNTVTANLN